MSVRSLSARRVPIIAILAAGAFLATAARAAEVKAVGPAHASGGSRETTMVASTRNGVPFASGPLRVSTRNPRYFEDPQGRIVYLTGSHTWENFADPTPLTGTGTPFNYAEYLSFLQRNNLNFIRLWSRDLSVVLDEANHLIALWEPRPWVRTGPGLALDGKPKYDLSKLNQAYFDRLRERVEAAGRQGIYVSIMLFEGCNLRHKTEWPGHPFHSENNINGVNGDPHGTGVGFTVHTLEVPEVNAYQEAYVRKVIDTVNDLDNVLYEISNESPSTSAQWQYHLIRFIHDYEKMKPKQHPVGMTGFYDTQNEPLFQSPAEWVSPGGDTSEAGAYKTDPPAADGHKVILVDTDHIWGLGGDAAWVWKSFCRGLNPMFMDPYSRPEDPSGISDPSWEAIRKNMGYARSYADRMNLADMMPSNDLASTKYCLSDRKTEFLIYLPRVPGAAMESWVTVNLSAAPGLLNAEWLRPSTGQVFPTGQVCGGTSTNLTPPFAGDAVLYLWSPHI